MGGRFVLALLGAALVAAAPASAAPAIHAHRGGSVLGGEPTFGENTLPAFLNAIRDGYVLEMDAKLTRDRVPVTFHDPGLERVTACEGPISQRTFEELKGCPVDVLGSPGSGLGTKPAPAPERIPTLFEVLVLARDEGARVNLEIKNVPGDTDYDPGEGFANTVLDAVVASGFPTDRLIVQSFVPANLAVAERRLPGVETALLTLRPLNSGAPSFATASGYEWISPEWPVSPEYVRDAKAMGLDVVPFTLNDAPAIQEASAVDTTALITDDPLLAQRALSLRRTDLVPDGLPPTVGVQTPRYASDTARGALFRFPVAGADQGSGLAGIGVESRLGGRAWRPVGGERPPGGVRFRGRPGRTYRFRVRARDRFGNVSAYAYAQTSIPLDERSRRLRYRGEWRETPARNAYERTVTRAGDTGATVSLRFTGRRVALIGRRVARGGQLLVRVGRYTRFVSLHRRRSERAVVFRSPPLSPGRHRIVVTAVSQPVVLDAIAIEQGPPPG